MDGERITPERSRSAQVREACAHGVTGARLMRVTTEIQDVARDELRGRRSAKLDAASFAEGLAYAMLYLVGQRDQTPAAYLASERENGRTR